MDNTSVDSSKQTSTREVRIEWECSGGLFLANEKEKTVVMNERESSDKPFDMFTLLSKKAGKNTLPQKNKKGETVRITEDGTTYITKKDGTIMTVRKNREDERDCI